MDVAFKLLIDKMEPADNEFKLLNIVVDVAFKLLIDVVCPLTSPNIVVDVLFKLLIDNIELVDNEFRLLNIVVVVACIFGMSKYDWLDNELILIKILVDVDGKLELFKFEYVEIELRLELILNTDNPDVVILPTTFKVVLHVVEPFNVAVPKTVILSAIKPPESLIVNISDYAHF